VVYSRQSSHLVVLALLYSIVHGSVGLRIIFPILEAHPEIDRFGQPMALPQFYSISGL
jgi:hypothetical protein